MGTLVDRMVRLYQDAVKQGIRPKEAEAVFVLSDEEMIELFALGMAAEAEGYREGTQHKNLRVLRGGNGQPAGAFVCGLTVQRAARERDVSGLRYTQMPSDPQFGKTAIVTLPL